MIDLTSPYLGLQLKNPVVASACPVNRDLDYARRLEDAGAAAIVMPSLFEEELQLEQEQMMRFLYEQDIGHGEASSFLPSQPHFDSKLESYLKDLQALKAHLDIPVIASLNGTSNEGWLDYGRELQQAGADALELNIYYVAANSLENAAAVERRYEEVLEHLCAHVTLPVAVKLSSHFSSLPNFVSRLQGAGATALVLFNRFYQPDINLDSLTIEPTLELSHAWEANLRIRWLAILSHQIRMDYAVTGGVHTSDEVAKTVLAGGHISQMCSALLRYGPTHITTVLNDLQRWLEDKEYHSLNEIRGALCQAHATDPTAYERANYLDVLDSYSPPPGVLR